MLDSDRPRFDAAIASARRLRDSALVEILLLGVVYFFGVAYLWRRHGSLPLSTWFGTPEPDGHRLTAAGWWYALVALPLVQFLILRWYFRVLIWARLLWKISRLDLQLVPTHPDRCGGLGFLAAGLRAFSTLLLAQGVLVAGAIANRIFFNGARLVDFKMELAVFTVVVLLFLLGPTLAFSPRLTHAKRKGVREYGAFAEKYVRAFDRKWLRGAPSEERLGSADVQSLADLGNSYEMVRRMQALPFSRSVVVELASAALAPVAPLLLTMMPLETLLEHVMKMIF